MLTRSGALMVLSAAVLLVAGRAADYPELVALGLVCASTVLVAAGYLVRRPAVTATRRIEPARVQEGAPAHAVLTVTNAGRRRSAPILAEEVVAGSRISVAVPSIAAGDSHEVSYPIAVARRGRYPVAPLFVGRCDPLRLVRLGRRWAEPSVLYVHPRVPALQPDPADATWEPAGAASGGQPGDGTEFHSLRPYQAGDDWRLIHWRSSARANDLMVRNNTALDRPRHLVVLDTQADRYSEDSFEHAVRVAAALCVAFARDGSAVTLCTTAGRSAATAATAGTGAAVTGMAAATPLLDLLADVERSQPDAGLRSLRALMPADRVGVLTVVTGRPDPAGLAVLPALRPRFAGVNLIHVHDRKVRAPVALDGVATVTVRTSDGLAQAWSLLERR